MSSLFQSATGEWHWSSIVMVFGWLISGVLILANLTINKDDRIKAYNKQRQLQSEIHKLDAHLLEEQRINASARHRLNRVETIALPRQVNAQHRAELIQKLDGFGPINIAFLGKAEPRNLALDFAALLQEGGCLGEFIPIEAAELGGVMVYIGNSQGDDVAGILNFTGVLDGVTSRLPLGFQSVPSEQNCILIGDNMNAFKGSVGQGGEGLGVDNRPVPEPR